MLGRLRTVMIVCDVPIETIETGRRCDPERLATRFEDWLGDGEIAVRGRVPSEDGVERPCDTGRDVDEALGGVCEVKKGGVGG